MSRPPAPADRPGAAIYLIRHGETEWSLSRRHTGRTDIPLTEAGEAQGRRLRPWLRGIDFAHVLTSPRQRAQRTCALAGLPVPPRVEPDLAEWDYGAYEGRTSCEIRADRPGWSLFRDGCPEGETPQAIADRADRLIARLGALEGRVALFSHGHFGAVLAARWIATPVETGAHFPIGVASLGILGQSANHADLRVIELWNATPTAHP